jgi:hypothetical protein
MKKMMLCFTALVVALALSAVAQDNMGSMGQSNSSASSSQSSTASTSTAAAPELKTLRGWVSDEKCGAKGANAKGAACAAKCVKGGEKIVFVNDKDKKVWNVKNPETLQDHVGHHVKLSAHVYPEGDIHVMSVSMAGKKKAASSSAPSGL